MNPLRPLALLAVLGLSLGAGYGLGRYRTRGTEASGANLSQETSGRREEPL